MTIRGFDGIGQRVRLHDRDECRRIPQDFDQQDGSPMIRCWISAIVPLTTILPRSMIATDVQNSDISERMWEEISTRLLLGREPLHHILEVDPA